ncbi:hypothetical protein BVC93_16130 [Mycobacterium sp. MS1601]|uniref:hypothetical protein n=1 Tax=Mycobacterium sp. MS1601 TaxID=1936029 RepID=UPI0009793E53|nr:hypothetical protein [Mycobacterium sp. MS1601]AQA03695.1 hypothetical protein BVC93_16130 [Mycobacterium sp. MS1601]
MNKLTITGVLATVAASAVVAGSFAAPALAEPAPFNGTYVGGDAENYWTVATACATEGCTGTVSSNQGWQVPTKMVGGLWHFIITKPDGAICADGSYAPAYIEVEVDPASLNGIVSLDDNYSCPGGTVTHSPFKLTKVG